MVYLYILQNEKGELYFGSTNDLKRRIFEHSSGKSNFTKGSSWKLMYYEAYLSKTDARQREHQIKYHGQAKRRLKNRLKNSLRQS